MNYIAENYLEKLSLSDKEIKDCLLHVLFLGQLFDLDREIKVFYDVNFNIEKQEFLKVLENAEFDSYVEFVSLKLDLINQILVKKYGII